jgi:hypothetical protein
VAGQIQQTASAFPYVYRWDRKGRKGMRCAMIVRSHAQNSCLLKFEDGFEMVTSRNAVVRAAGMKNSVSVARKEARLKYPSLPDSEVSIPALKP